MNVAFNFTITRHPADESSELELPEEDDDDEACSPDGTLSPALLESSKRTNTRFVDGGPDGDVDGDEDSWNA